MSEEEEVVCVEINCCERTDLDTTAAADGIFEYESDGNN